MRRLAVVLTVWLGLASLALAAEPGLSGQRLDTVGSPVAVDDSGQVIGPVIEVFGGFGVALLRASGRDAWVAVGRDVILGVLPAKYESGDCSGTPLIGILPPGVPALVVEPAAVGRVGEIVVGTGDATTRTIGSEWTSTLPTSTCEPPSGDADQVVRETIVLTVTDFYSPPFRLR